MTDVYVVRNQLGHYWAKSKHWVDGSDPKTVLRTRHEDEAVNSLFELSAKDIDLRGEVFAAELDERGNPIIEASSIPVPQLDEPEVEPTEATAADPAADDNKSGEPASADKVEQLQDSPDSPAKEAL